MQSRERVRARGSQEPDAKPIFQGVAGRVARTLAIVMVPAAMALAGCGAGAKVTSPNGGVGTSSTGNFSIAPATVTIDTNCTGCNQTNSSGLAVEQFTATLTSGGTAGVTWTLSGGDVLAGPGTISSTGQYTPPGYLTADRVSVTVTATLASNSSDKATATVTVTPGFLQPLTPENAAVGANGTVTITGYIAEAGGTDGINYAVSSAPTGASGGEGSVGTPGCVRGAETFTYCTATYTAPSALSSTAATYVVATVGTSASKTAAEVLLNTEGVDSNPASHQAQLATPVDLGSSGGNTNDYDTTTVNGQQQISDCCGGTLGSLIQNASGTQYLLSCNHVLARSDQASTGEEIIQPGLIDANCTPLSDGGTETLVGMLTGFVPLKSNNNVDAAIAQVESGAVSTSGNILELGAKQANGTLAAAPPGVSSTGGKGENGTLNMSVAKSGRTTGLTCAAISSVSALIEVSYYTNCAETNPYITKTYDNQIVITGDQFSDAGDSGSLVVDAGDAEPVGLFFAGGVNSDNVDVGIANPVSEVLSELGSQMGATYTFVGTTDHPVSCLNYGDATVTAAQGRTLTADQAARAESALNAARALVNPSAGILGVATGKSSDRSGEGAVLVYVDQNMNATVPQTVSGVRTVVIPTTVQAVNAGTAPRTPAQSQLPAAALNQAVSAKQQLVAGLLKQNPAFFGVGVGQSLDNPKEAALVIFVDRSHVPATLPATIDGLRTRYVIMDRLHVTRSYATGLATHSRCMSHAASAPADVNDPFHLHRPPSLKIY
jgi:hypothetical protein